MPLSTLAEVRTEVRALLNEATASFWSDTQIDEWIAQACLDISVKTHCVETTGTVTLVQGTVEYALPTTFANPTVSDTEARVISMYGAYLSNVGMLRVRPTVWAREQPTTQTTPYMVTHWGQRVFVQPPPSAAGTLNLLVAVNSDTVADIPMAFRDLILPRALYRAKLRDRKYAEAGQVYAEYANGLMYQRQDLIERGTDTKADQHIPDRAERTVVTAGG